MAVAPGFRVPTFRDVTVWVHALSEYTPRFIAVMDPFKGTIWLVLRTAAVVAVSAMAAMTSAIIATVGNFWIFIFCSL